MRCMKRTVKCIRMDYKRTEDTQTELKIGNILGKISKYKRNSIQCMERI
jgi:hypothetical protein